MNKEELYNLAINNVQKYSLLNEIFAIRDKRVEQVDYTIGVNGFISLDSLNKYVEIIDYINKLETNIDEAIELLSKGVAFCENDSQGAYDVCNNAINREKKVIEILKRGK